MITTDKACTRDVLIQVEGKNKFLGQIGQFRGNRSVRVTRVCQESPRRPRRTPPSRRDAPAGGTAAPTTRRCRGRPVVTGAR